MTRFGFSLMIALFALAAVGLITGVATTAPASTGDTAAVAGDQETPPQAPQGVSAAEPGTKPPEFDGPCCPNCGAPCPKYKGRDRGPQMMGDRGGRGGRGHRGSPGLHAHGRDGRGMHAHGMMDGRRGMAAERMLRHASDLELTDDQVTKLETLVYDTEKRLIGLRADIESERLEVHKLMQSGSDDLTQIKRHLSAISKAQLGMKEAKFENLFEARKILTDEQKAKVKEKYPMMGRILH